MECGVVIPAKVSSIVHEYNHEPSSNSYTSIAIMQA